MGKSGAIREKVTSVSRKGIPRHKQVPLATVPEIAGDASQEPMTMEQKGHATYPARRVLLAARSAYSVTCDNRRVVNERANAFTYRVLQTCGVDPAKSRVDTPVTMRGIVDVAYDILDAEKTDRLFEALDSPAML